MAQKSVREYDAKKLFNHFLGKKYKGHLVCNEDDLTQIPQTGKRVIKPDQLFGKRGKLGLIGINLNYSDLVKWFLKHINQKIKIDNLEDTLNCFIVEPSIDHEKEYYLSFTTEREYDVVTFSDSGGIDIEDNQDKLKQIFVSPLDSLSEQIVRENFHSDDDKIIAFILESFSFFRRFGFCYLEVNPFVKDGDDEIQCLDMVARVDSCELFRQKKNRGDLTFYKPFGMVQSQTEKEIEILDEKSGSSLKFSLLNPQGSLWFVLGGGGSSVITLDTISEMGLIKKVGNYGELSGNPSKEENMMYTKFLIEQLLASSSPEKKLCIVGGISNFTAIDTMFEGICEAITIYHKELHEQKVTILVRRGGINEDKAMETIKSCCKLYDIKLHTENSDRYITTILHHLEK